MFKKKRVLKQSLHEKLKGIVKEAGDFAMVPEAREAITDGNFVSIDLTSGSEPSSALLLNKDEMCIFLSLGILVKRTEKVRGYASQGISYESVLVEKQQIYTTADYETMFSGVAGMLVLTTERMIFLPNDGDDYGNDEAICIEIKDLLSVSIIDNVLLVIQSKHGKKHIYTKYPAIFRMTLQNLRKVDRVVLDKDAKELEV